MSSRLSATTQSVREWQSKFCSLFREACGGPHANGSLDASGRRCRNSNSSQHFGGAPQLGGATSSQLRAICRSCVDRHRPNINGRATNARFDDIVTGDDSKWRWLADHCSLTEQPAARQLRGTQASRRAGNDPGSGRTRDVARFRAARSMVRARGLEGTIGGLGPRSP